MTFARVRALIVVAVLFVTAGVVIIMAIERDSQTSASAQNTCGDGLIPAKIKMPDQSADVVINVINGTSNVGLAQQVAGEFSNRGFKIHQTTTAPDAERTDEIAIIKYGPEAVGRAWLVSAYFLVDEAELRYDSKHQGNEVDVVIGSAFQQLATTTEVNQSIAAMGKPRLPEGTCEAAE
jgi:predicted dinucleotide-binding enzyme